MILNCDIVERFCDYYKDTRNEGKVEGLTRNVSILGALARSDKLISASSGSRQFSTGRIFHINDKDGLIR